METDYPIIANCNFESRDDEIGQAVHAARLAVDKGLTDDADLIEALGDLERILTDLADQGDVLSAGRCGKAEKAVADAWTDDVQEAVADERESRYVD